MSYVEVRSGNSDSKKSHADYIEDALKELKRKMKKDNTLYDYRRHEFYMAPSEKRKFKRNEAFKRRKREEMKERWISRKSHVSREK